MCQHFDKWGFYDKCQEITTPFKWVTSLAIVPAGWRPLCYPELKDAVNKSITSINYIKAYKPS